MVHLLLERGADVGAKTFKGETPLHCAGRMGQFDAAKLLLEAGADVSTPNLKGTTPLDCSDSDIRVHVLIKMVGERRARCVAFASGYHERLGKESLVLGLEQGVIRMVLADLVSEKD